MIKSNNNYLGVAEQLREKILNEVWLPSEKLPPERTLSQEFDVARETIRRALRVLESEHLIRRMRGSGTYVNPKESHRIPLMIDYTGSMNSYAPNLKRKILNKEIINATDSLAADLKIEHSAKVLHVERIDYNNDIAVAYDKVYIPEHFSYYLRDIEIERVDFLDIWSNMGKFQISHCQQYIEADTAADSCLKNLSLPIGSPVLKSTEFYYVDNTTIAGKFISFYHPKYISINSRYNWKEGKQDGN